MSENQIRGSLLSRDQKTALTQLIRFLPDAYQAKLQGLYGQEDVLLEELRASLNQLTREGVWDRRSFLRVLGILSTAGLATLVFPRSAAAAGFYNMGAFWKKRTSGLASSGYPANSGSDPYWDYVVLLMNMDTYSGGPTTLFADDSNVGKTPAISGSPYIDSTASTSSPYSGRTGSASFNGSSDYVTLPSSSGWQIGTGDFTIEFWINANSTQTSSNPRIFSLGAYDATNGYNLYIEDGATFTSRRISFQYWNGSATVDAFLASLTAANTWLHCAITRASGTLRWYIGGIEKTSTTLSSSLGSSSLSFYIGSEGNHPNYRFQGALADLRIYNDVAKYTANFTAPTSPIGLGVANDRYWGYCVLACPFDNSLKDMSGKLFSATSSAVLSTSAKKFGSASLALNGTNQFISAPDSSDWALGSSDFTIEAHIQMSSLPPSSGGTGATYYCIVGQWNASNSSWALYVRNNSGTYQLSLWTYDGSTAAESLAKTWPGVATNTWYHVALVRKGTVLSVFVDGISLGSSSYSGILYDSSTSCGIGAQSDSLCFFSGYIDSLRITKGYARYTSNFTVPSASFPVGKDETVDPFWTYTVLALHMDDLTDSTGRHFITNGNSVTNNTTTKKYGTASASFNGTNQYLSTPAQSDFEFGTGDFTIEYFAYSSSTGLMGHFKNEAAAGSYTSSSLSLASSSTALSIRIGSGTSYANLISASPSISVPTSTWNHWAMVRNGSTLSIYLNGISVYSSTAVGSNSISNAGFLIGQHAGNGMEYFSGYIDDFRITKGIARYIQNFTPPTRAFAGSAASLDFDPFWSNVEFLANFNGSNGATTFTDSASAPKTITGYGSAQISTSQSKFGGQSLLLNGSTGYLDVALGTLSPNNIYTMEGWIRTTSTANMVVMSFGVGFDFYAIGNAMRLSDGQYRITGTRPLNDGQWHHVALVADGSNNRIYVDGVQDGSSYGSVFTLGSSLRIGMQAGSSNFPFDGYFDEFRITRGIARYQGSFAPPPSALPATSSLPTGTSNIVTTGLVAYLDSGDANSYPGGGQTWANLVASPADSSSRSAYDFYLGSSSSSESSDPAFNGLAGGRSIHDYFAFDGGDYFTLAGSNTAFFNSLHKTGAAFTIICCVRFSALTSTDYVFTTSQDSSGSTHGVFLRTLNTGAVNFFVGNATGSNPLDKTSQASLVAGKNHFIALSLTEGSSSFFYLNGSYLPDSSGNTTWTASYSSPSSSSASNPAAIGARTAQSNYFGSGNRIYMLQIYNRALTKTELDQNFAALCARFGL